MSIKRRAVHERHAQFDCTVIKVILMVYVPHCSIVNGTWHLLGAAEEGHSIRFSYHVKHSIKVI